MTSVITEQIEPKTAALVKYILRCRDGATVTEAMKICYLVDLGAQRKLGHQLSNLEYKRYKHGPYDSRIYEYLKDKDISVDEFSSKDGFTFDVYRFKEDLKIEEMFSAEEISVVDKILELAAGYGAVGLTKIAYNTDPMKKIGAEYGSSIGMNEQLILTSD